MRNSTIIFVIEKQKNNSEKIKTLLQEDSTENIRVYSIHSIKDVLKKISDIPCDAIIIDVSFFKSLYKSSIQELRNFAIATPLLVIANKNHESLAIAAMKDGAQDFLIREDLDSRILIHSIRSAIERQHLLLNLEQKSHEFQANEARLLSVIVNNADGIVVVDENMITHFVNPAAKKMLGKNAEHFIGKKFKFKIDEEKPIEHKINREELSPIVVEMRTVVTNWEGIKAYLVSLRDITARKNAETALKISEERYALAVKGSKDGLWDWNLKNDLIYYSLRWKNMLGYSNSEIGQSPNEWLDRVHPDDIDKLKESINMHITGETEHFEIEHRLKHKNGSFRWFLSRGTTVKDLDGNAVRLAGSQSDITERKEAEKSLQKALSDLKFALASEKVLLDELDKKNRELVELSITDGLTGLYNHRFIQERFDFEFKRAKRYHVLLSCMILDIDHFKKVNDTYGHQFGDLVLRKISNILKKQSRDVDICGRYGGEEFMIITNQNTEGVMKYANKLHSAIESAVFESDEASIHCTVSIGVAVFDKSISTKQELIERADKSLYDAKENGRNQVRLWREEDQKKHFTLDENGIERLKQEFDQLSLNMRATYMESTQALLRAVDAKDHYTLEHCENVSRYAVKTGKLIGLTADELDVLKYAGLLHDIGKIGVDENILVKKDTLTEEEFEILKKHPIIGVNILKDVKFLENEIPIILYHHERFDGKGYPQGLVGKQIPIGARIMCVVDAFDAMTTDREFKEKMNPKNAISELIKGKNTQFDPEIVDVFVSIAEDCFFNKSDEQNKIEGNNTP